MEDTKLGGILGYDFSGKASILQCYNTGDISKARIAGGIVGNSNGIVENCYNTGTIESDDTSYISGGISGRSNNRVIKNCYNAGSLMGKNEIKSGIALLVSGKFMFRNYYLSNCGAEYANFNEKSGNIGVDEVSVSVTEEELRNLAQSLGEDFTEDVENINNGYPILKWQLRN